MQKIFQLALIVWLTGGCLFGQELVRRSFMGIRLEPVSEEIRTAQSIRESGGIHIIQVFDQSSAKVSGLEVGDVVVRLGNDAVESVPQFLTLLRQYQTGDRVDLQLYRNGKKKKIDLQLTSLPQETYEGAKVSYGSVKAPHGQLRTILTLPENPTGKSPVVYVLQGIDCSSVDAPFNPDGGFNQMIRFFNDHGYATFRVEKSGVGDSKGTPCSDCDFLDDQAGFLAGLQHLKEMEEIDSDRVYIFGLSMGGVWAPLIAAEEKVRGIAVYGTIARPFMEYMLENFRRQDILAGNDFADIESSSKRRARLYHYLYQEKLSPEEIIEQYPEMQPFLRAVSNDPEGEEIRHLHAGRLYTFQQQLYAANISEAWKGAATHVLTVWGKGDYVSSRDDHQMIADMVNSWNPGSASFVEVNANHWFGTATSMEEAYANVRNGVRPPINHEIFETVTNWLDSVN